MADPKDPGEPITRAPIPVTDDEKQVMTSKNFEATLKRSASLGAGLWLKFFQSLGIELSGNSDKNTDKLLKFDRLETWTFRPSDEYMSASVQAREVQEWFLRYGTKKRLYIVTGVKVAYGAKVSDMIRTSRSGKVLAGFDGNAAGVPFAAGPKGEASKGIENAVRFESDDPFVFAYQLREIRYRKGVLTNKPYRDGALYVLDGDQSDNTAGVSKNEKKGQLVFVDLDEDDVAGEDVGMESVVVWDDSISDERDWEDGDNNNNLCSLIIP
jgi:hypothetical protein